MRLARRDGLNMILWRSDNARRFTGKCLVRADTAVHDVMHTVFESLNDLYNA